MRRDGGMAAGPHAPRVGSALDDREPFSAQNSPALLVTLDLVSESGGGLLVSGGGQLPRIAQGVNITHSICDGCRIWRVTANGLDAAARINLNR